MIARVHLIKENLELSVFQHYHCAAYILNLVVGAALETNIIPRVVKKLHNFISIVRNSSKTNGQIKGVFSN